MLSKKTALFENFCRSGLSVIQIESQAIADLAQKIDIHFSKACEILFNCPERIIVTGMGKSSYIGGKIAATLSSTGSPAFFVHPAEASHGDLGMITAKDVMIIVSYSGETPEILTILPLIKHLKIPLITLTGNMSSTLAKSSAIALDVSVKAEACPLGLAPTASTTAALVMGDALAVALLQGRGFNALDFARSHPGGQLGKRLLLSVKDLMRTGKNIPKVNHTMPVIQALVEISEKALGMTTIIDERDTLLGIYTDGDLRRTLDKNLNVHTTCIGDVMSKNPKTILETKLAVEALQIMEERCITSLVVCNPKQQISGIIHLHDLLHAGVV